MEIVVSWLLLALLLIAGLINYLFHPATAKLYSSLFRRFFPAQLNAVAVSSEEMGTEVARKRNELMRVFDTFDKNRDGFLTKQEIGDSLNNIGIPMTDDDVKEVMERLDANEDGLVDIHEFCDLFEPSEGRGAGITGEGGEEDNDLKEAFDVFDGDGDGLISVEELGRVLASFGMNEGKKVESCREMIRKVDLDGDGKVSIEEFRKMMRAGGRIASAF